MRGNSRGTTAVLRSACLPPRRSCSRCSHSLGEVRTLLFIAAVVVAVVVTAGISHGEVAQPYTVGDLRRVFMGAEVELRARRVERQDDIDICSRPDYVTGFHRDTAVCSNTASSLTGRRDVAAGVPQQIVMFWSPSARQRWVIYLFKTQADAAAAAERARKSVGALLPDDSLSRISNAVLVYVDPIDEIRFRGALEQAER